MTTEKLTMNLPVSKKKVSDDIVLFLQQRRCQQDLIDFIESKNATERNIYAQAYVDFCYNGFDQFRNFSSGWDDYWYLVKSGCVSRIKTTGAVCWMLWAIQCLRTFETRDIPGTIQFLRDNDELLDTEFWLIFEEPHDRLFKFEFFDRKLPGRTWTTLFVQLVQQDLLDRDRLFDGLLRVFEYGYPDNENRWFVGLFLELDPTIDELLAHEQKVYQLLETRNASTQAMILTLIQKLDQAGKFAPRFFLDHCHALLREKTKGRAKQGIAILEKIVAHHKSFRGQALQATIEGLHHESPEIQQTSVDLLLKYNAFDDPKISGALNKLLPSLAASVVRKIPGVQMTSPAPDEKPDMPDKTPSKFELRIQDYILFFRNLADASPTNSIAVTDHLIRYIANDTFSVPQAVDAAVDVIGFKAFKVSRWTKPFLIVAEQSGRHAEAIQELLEGIIPHVEKRSLSGFLEVLVETSAILNRPIQSEPCREFLQSLSGSGKAAKLAKKLLEL